MVRLLTTSTSLLGRGEKAVALGAAFGSDTNCGVALGAGLGSVDPCASLSPQCVARAREDNKVERDRLLIFPLFMPLQTNKNR